MQYLLYIPAVGGGEEMP